MGEGMGGSSLGGVGDPWMPGSPVNSTPLSFSLETTWDLKAPLKSLGVRAPFDPSAADFSPLSGKR